MEINNVNKCAQCRHCSICKYVIDRGLIMGALLRDEAIKDLFAGESLFSLDFVCQKYERDYSKRDDDPEPLDVRPISSDADEYDCIYNAKTGSLVYTKKMKNNDNEEYPF